MSRTVLVVPCYQEERRLDAGAFLRALDRQETLDLLLVDDGSHDRTRAVLDDLAARRPGRVEVLGLEENRGKAEAVRLGVLAALRRDDVARFGYWDADLSTPLEELPRFEAALDAAPGGLLVMGARVRLLGRSIERRAIRHYLGRVFATAASLALALPVYDTQCGAKLFRRTPVTEGIFRAPFLSRWIFDVELLARLGAALRAGGATDVAAAVHELPLRRWHDVAGSKVRPRDFLVAVLELWRIRRRHPPRGGGA